MNAVPDLATCSAIRPAAQMAERPSARRVVAEGRSATHEAVMR